MADISSFLKKILEAIYGEEVRGSIHDALAAMNKESSSAMEFAATAKDSAKASAEKAKNEADTAGQKAAEALDSAGKAAQSETNAKASETAAEGYADLAVDAAERAGGYVMDPAKVKHDPQKEQDFMMLRRYCIVNRRKMSELTADDFRKAGITGKS